MIYRANITYNKERNKAGVEILKFLDKYNIKTIASFNNIKPGQARMKELKEAGVKSLFICGDETIYDRIFDMENTKELTTENIGRLEKRLQFTSILSYKGLENKHIILLISKRTEIDKFELYVGMTRAIYDLEILILE